MSRTYILSADHPLTTDPAKLCLCPFCRLGFHSGQEIVLVPVRTPPPGTGLEGFDVLHVKCVSLDPRRKTDEA